MVAKPYTAGVSLLFFYEVISFVFGLLFGSFLNVCISRLPQHDSIVHPGSHCPQCQAPIRWYHNVPVLSWVLLRGRCRDCKAPIPWRYPAVELATAIWFAYVVYRCYASWENLAGPISTETIASLILIGVGMVTVGFLLIGLMVMDWQTFRLPDAFTFSGIAIGMLLIFVRAAFLGPKEDQILLTRHHIQLTSPGGAVDHGNLFFTGPEALIMGRIAAICGAALILLLVRWTYKALRKREGMGLGDVKLLAMIAAFLGFWPAILSLFVGVIAATVYVIVLVVRGKANAASRLAFGSFLAFGGLVAAQFGNRIIDMYTALIR